MKLVYRSTVALTIAHAFGYAISLAEVPILARALGAEAYGELIWVQATALLASIFVDYGFTLSASRSIAQDRANKGLIKKIAGDVFFAKTLLMLAVLTPLVLVYVLLMPVQIGLAIAGFAYLVAFGMSPFWFFQGTERMGRAIAVEIVTRSIALVAMLVFVTEPLDSVLALWLMASGALTCTLITVLMCRIEVGRFNGSFRGAKDQLRYSTPIFIYKSSGNLVATAATTVLGAVAGKAAVGVFAPAEKIVKAVIGLALPILNAFYPHLSRLFVEDKAKKNRQSFLLVMLITLGGLISAVALSFVGPTIVQWLLGPGFEKAIGLLLLMVWLIPLRLMNQTIGLAVLLPAKMERGASVGMLGSAVASLVLGAWFATSHGAAGMVWGMLLGEVGLLFLQLYIVAKTLVRNKA